MGNTSFAQPTVFPDNNPEPVMRWLEDDRR